MLIESEEDPQRAIEGWNGLNDGGVVQPHSIEGLGSSNSVFIKNCLSVFGVCCNSEGSNVRRLMMSPWVRSGSVSRYGSIIASRLSVDIPSNRRSITRKRIDAEEG
jgi:hypothetical protein